MVCGPVCGVNKGGVGGLGGGVGEDKELRERGRLEVKAKERGMQHFPHYCSLFWVSVAVASSRAPWHPLHGHQPRVKMGLGGGGLTRFLCHQGFVGPWTWFQYRERPKCCSSETSSTRCTSSPSADTLSQGRAMGGAKEKLPLPLLHTQA